VQTEQPLKAGRRWAPRSTNNRVARIFAWWGAWGSNPEPTD
jgi:hypothetical protein